MSPIAVSRMVVLSPQNLSLVRDILREYNREEILKTHGLRASDRLLFCRLPLTVLTFHVGDLSLAFDIQ